jgi:hypothetical protein
MTMAKNVLGDEVDVGDSDQTQIIPPRIGDKESLDDWSARDSAVRQNQGNYMRDAQQDRFAAGDPNAMGPTGSHVSLGSASPYQTRQAAFESPFLKQQMGAVGSQIGSLQNQRGAQIATGPQDQIRQQQMSYLDALRATAAGQGPSVAQNQLQAATDQSLAAQSALAASSRGGNPMLAQRAAMHNQAQIQQQAGNQSAQLRAQEMQQTQGMLGTALGGVRGQDQSIAGSQAQLDAQHQAQINQMVQQYVGMGMNAQQAQFQAMQDYEKQRVSSNIQKYGVDSGVAVQNAANTNNAVGSVMSGIATGAGMLLAAL